MPKLTILVTQRDSVTEITDWDLWSWHVLLRIQDSMNNGRNFLLDAIRSQTLYKLNIFDVIHMMFVWWLFLQEVMYINQYLKRYKKTLNILVLDAQLRICR